MGSLIRSVVLNLGGILKSSGGAFNKYFLPVIPLMEISFNWSGVGPRHGNFKNLLTESNSRPGPKVIALDKVLFVCIDMFTLG